METNELKKIWKTLADNKLVDNNIAKENIDQIITRKGFGILEKLYTRIKKDIRIGIINSVLTTAVIIWVYFFRTESSHDKKPHFILIVILGYFLLRLSRDLRKYRLLKLSKISETIKDCIINGYTNFKAIIKKDIILNISFIIFFNIWVVVIYYKAFGNVNNIDFSSFNGQLVGFILMIVLILHLFVGPWILKYIYKTRYNNVIKDFEQTINELEENN